jgi:AraC-like DNA-binding protein
MLETGTNLQGLGAVVRLKTEVLRQLAQSRPVEWQGHIDRFLDGIVASKLEDSSAVFVLLADLLQQIRLLLGEDAADGKSVERSAASVPEAPSKNDVLAQFRAELEQLFAPMVWTRQFASPLVAQMLCLVHERYTEPLTLEALAAVLGRSTRYLSTLFRKQTGQSVYSLMTQTRMHHAAALIRTGEKIEVVSLLVGYRSKKNFYRHFKERYGVTPLAYRTAVAGVTPPSGSRVGIRGPA